MRGCLVSPLLDTSRRQSISIEAVKKALLTVIYDKQGSSEALGLFRLTKAIPLLVGFVTSNPTYPKWLPSNAHVWLNWVMCVCYHGKSPSFN